jgi:hypothetical protein
MTVAVVKFAVMALRVVPVADAKSRRPETERLVPVAPVNPRLETVPKEANRLVDVVLVPVALVHVRLVGLKLVANRLVNDPCVANAFVEVTEVNTRSLPVPLVKVSVWSEALPSTVKVEVTVVEAEMRPPKSWRVVVEKDPRAVTD